MVTVLKAESHLLCAWEFATKLSLACLTKFSVRVKDRGVDFNVTGEMTSKSISDFITIGSYSIIVIIVQWWRNVKENFTYILEKLPYGVIISSYRINKELIKHCLLRMDLISRVTAWLKIIAMVSMPCKSNRMHYFICK